MAHGINVTNNKIGSTIQYLRKSYYISQSKLCKGLCSLSTLSRIEACERDADSLLIETLLERLDRSPSQYILILSETEYKLYQQREFIKGAIKDKSYEKIACLVNDYKKNSPVKESCHKQFILYCEAMLNEIQGKSVDITIEFLIRAIKCTVPDFETINIKDYILGKTELNLIIEIIQRLIKTPRKEESYKLLGVVLNYLDANTLKENDNSIYPKVAFMAAELYFHENKMEQVISMCNKGIEKRKILRNVDYLSELHYIKAKAEEYILKKQNNPDYNDCILDYLKAYYLIKHFNCNLADEIKMHLQKEYKWQYID